MSRLLFVHAHPDDEASKGAATAARYVDAGAEVVLVTCTLGDAGEVLNPSHPPVTADDLAAVRAAELAASVGAIGFTRAHQLGYHDSGYHLDPADIPAGTFAALDLDEPAAALAALLRQERPHVVVTYPPDGGYPHPDHVRVADATLRALPIAADADADVAGEPWRVPRTVYATGFPRVRMVAIHDAMLAETGSSPYADWVERLSEQEARDVDREPDVSCEVAAWFARRDAALRAHATQVDPDGHWFAVPRDLEAAVWPWETYCLLDGTPVPAGADDLFAGLVLDD